MSLINNKCLAHYLLPNLWSLILISITIISIQATQRIERHPAGPYMRLRGQDLLIPCHIRDREGECLWIKKTTFGHSEVKTNLRDKYVYERESRNGDCSIHILNLDPKTDEGEWMCQVSPTKASEAALISNAAIVSVLVAPNPPQIKNIVKFNQLEIQSDRMAEISCSSVNGNPLPRIEWFINEENVTQNSHSTPDSDSSEYPGVTSVLSHTFKRSHRNSTITCKSIHQTVNQNSSAIINVLYEPQVSVPQKTYTISEGDDLHVDCQVDANPTAQAFWRSHDKLENTYNQIKLSRSTLHISQVVKQMNGAIFECTAQNQFGTAIPQPIVLDVLFEPTLAKSSSSQQSVELGGTIELFCQYEGNPKPKVLWYQISPITDQVRNRHNSGEDPGILVIKNITYHDEGFYYCEALNHNSITNREAIARSERMIVDVLGKPSFIQKLDTTIGYRGTETDIEQLFCSDPEPNIAYWQYGSIRIDVLPNRLTEGLIPETVNSTKGLRHKARELIPIDKYNAWPRSTCYRAILSIVNTDLHDQREYTLVVENSRGTTESVIKLKVNSPISAAIMITIGLIVLIMLLALTLVTMLVIKRRKLAKDKADDESKAEARAMKSDTDKTEQESEKSKENHELVYANLDFAKPEPPKPKPKPQAQQRQHKTNGGNSGTEYAQITFTNKADL